MMATISHPCLIQVYDYDVDGEFGAYLLMEYVDGNALSDMLTRRTKLKPHETMRLVAQAADALQAMHDAEVLHGDVRPTNVLVRPDFSIVLTRVGGARLGARSQLSTSTSIYTAPEVTGGGPESRLSDVYSLGVVAYECLVGGLPVPFTNAENLPAMPPDTPDDVRSLVDHARVKDPGSRWSSAGELADAARRAAEALQASPGSRPYDVFICYRRDDAGGYAGWLFDRLAAAFGEAKVFIDTESIGPGQDWVEATLSAVQTSDVVLVIIGRGWINSRLNNGTDPVKKEIAAAFRARKRVVPVLVDGAEMPSKTELPHGLKQLANHNAVRLDRVRFRNDTKALVDAIRSRRV
jgi:serine/threonine protein kinase